MQKYDFDKPIPVGLSAGNYAFVVSKLERKTQDDKIHGKVAVASVHLILKSLEDGSQQTHVEDIKLIGTQQWKIVRFFTACGLRKHADKTPIMPQWWVDVVNKTGFLAVKETPSKNDPSKSFLNVEWLDEEPKGEPETTAPGEAADPM